MKIPLTTITQECNALSQGCGSPALNGKALHIDSFSGTEHTLGVAGNSFPPRRRLLIGA
jgi:hypothetical protein